MDPPKAEPKTNPTNSDGYLALKNRARLVGPGHSMSEYKYMSPMMSPDGPNIGITKFIGVPPTNVPKPDISYLSIDQVTGLIQADLLSVEALDPNKTPNLGKYWAIDPTLQQSRRQGAAAIYLSSHQIDDLQMMKMMKLKDDDRQARDLALVESITNAIKASKDETSSHHEDSESRPYSTSSTSLDETGTTEEVSSDYELDARYLHDLNNRPMYD